jgi:hypothetical protein
MYQALRKLLVGTHRQTGDLLSLPSFLESRLKKEKMRKQTYLLMFGFTIQLVNGEERPQCVICCEVLAYDNLNALTLYRHITTRHSCLVNKSLALFE